MKKLLLNKLITGIIPAMMFHVTLNAQIIYTDVNPDTTISTLLVDGLYPYYLDLNNDGIVDFNIDAVRAHNWATGALSLFVAVTPLNNNEVLDSFPGGVYYPFALGSNSLIGTNSVWGNTTNQILRRENAGSYVSGLWSYNTDTFLGLKLLVAGDTSYGWALLSIQQTGTGNATEISFTIKEYAYNTISNQNILAGDTGFATTGIAENIASINLYPNPASNHLNINFGNNKIDEISLTDITGKIIRRINSHETQQLEVNINEFAEGIYVVQIQTEEFKVTKRLIVVK